MKTVTTPEQQRQIDKKSIEDFGIPALILMENAGRSAAEKIGELLKQQHKEVQRPTVLILCGSGNNGGDGFCIARHLYAQCFVRIAWVGEKEKMSSETLTNFRVAEKMGIPMAHIASELDVKTLTTDTHCIIDALIGVGGSEDLRGIITFLLDKVSGMWDSLGQLPTMVDDTLRIAIDVPTGLNALTGSVHPSAFRADHTITMITPKIGMLINEGIEFCGTIHSVSIGEPESLRSMYEEFAVLEKSDIRAFLPKRSRKTSKFDYGRVVVIGGSHSMPGAPCLAAHAALKSGAGLVELYSPVIHPHLIPEVMPHILRANSEGGIASEELSRLLDSTLKADVIVIGPGLGKSAETLEMIRELIFSVDARKPMIIDADGLSAIRNEDILRKSVVLTPHIGEYARLVHKQRDEVSRNIITEAQESALSMNCTILIKNVPTVISNGKKTILNTHGNPGMATAGTGDVLSGIIGALLAQNISPFYAAALGAFIHSEAGDCAAQYSSEETLIASDIISSLHTVFA